MVTYCTSTCMWQELFSYILHQTKVTRRFFYEAYANQEELLGEKIEKLPIKFPYIDTKKLINFLRFNEMYNFCTCHVKHKKNKINWNQIIT